MKRFHLLTLTLLMLQICLSHAAGKPNIVMIITDDQGYGDLACHGNPVIKTPHMDALAAESSRLDDYHVAPTCSPTRAALLTGHWANRTGVWHTIMGRSMIRTNEITLGSLLLQNGYTTGMFGKWHLGDNFPYRPEDRGFDEVYHHAGGGVGQTPDHWDNAYFGGSYFHNGKVVPAKGFCTDVFFEQGHKFIRKCAAGKKPFFAYISTNAPHGPLHCPEKSMKLYPDLPKNTAAFFGMITNIDENLGATRTLLEELGIADDTIFIFTTDNGTATGAKVFNDGMRGQKGSQYDGGHRVPFFLHWPKAGMNKKHISEEITHGVDIVPTLLDLTESKAPKGYAFDGISVKPLLVPDGRPDWPDRMLVTDSQRVVDPIKWRKSSVMNNRWRLIDGSELYDMEADPGQKTDVAAEHPEQVKAMRAFYDAWWNELQPTFSQTTEIHVGDPEHPTVSVNCHDWLNGDRAPPWSQSQVRRAGGLVRDGRVHKAKFKERWAIKVVTPGTYEISIMRWPKEADLPISSALSPGRNVPGATRAYRCEKGDAIPVTKAVLKIDGKTVSEQPVDAKDKAITFTTELKKGSIKLAPYFVTPKGGEIGAYYAVIRKQ